MSEEKRCPVYIKTSMYNYECNAKILKREPLLSHDRVLSRVLGPIDLRGSRTEEGDCLYYSYICENGHILNRPDWWADVPIVPPGTLSGQGIKNTPHGWYAGLKEEEKEKVWK